MKIDYTRIRQICDERGYTMVDASRMCNITYSTFRSVAVFGHNTSTETIAKLCYGFGLRPSSFVKFDFDYPSSVMYMPPSNPKGVVTYKPLIMKLSQNIVSGKGPANTTELFDLLGNYSGMTEEVSERVIASALKARGYELREKNQHEGLSAKLRQQINNDKSVYMPLIYDICKTLKCSIDDVLYYK